MNLLLLDSSDFIDGSNTCVRLTGRRFDHIRSVFHAEVGKELRIGLINGNLGAGTITSIDDFSVELSVMFTDAPPPPLPLTLICSMPRPKSFKKTVEAATSLGIKKMFFIESWRVEKSYWQSPVLSDESIHEHISAGLEQARDTTLPKVSFRKRFKPFVEDELPSIIGNDLALVAHPYNAESCPFAVRKPVTLVIGPEGGFIPYEIELLKEAGCVPVTIGGRILRVETAVAAFTGRLW
jgi:RsmE family RNA methyltransferase